MRTAIAVCVGALLFPAMLLAQLTGRLQTFDGKPIPQGRVELHLSDTTLDARTGDDGSFWFPPILPGDSGVLKTLAVGYHERRITVTAADSSMVLPVPSIAIRLCLPERVSDMVAGGPCDLWYLQMVRGLHAEVVGAAPDATGFVHASTLTPVRLRIWSSGSCVRPGPVIPVLDGPRVHIMVWEYRNDAGCSDGREFEYEHTMLHTFTVPGQYDVYVVQQPSDLLIRFVVTDPESPDDPRAQRHQ